MMRPMTCISLVVALGAGLYLYQEKHTAQLLDRDINRTIKQADTSRDRIGLLKAEWALLNDVERLQGLAGQHLQLQPLAPVQFARLEDLPGRLPAVSATPVNVAPVDDTPVAPIPMPLPAPIRAPAPMVVATPNTPPRLPLAAQAAAASRAAVAQAAPAAPPRSAPVPGPLAAPTPVSVQLAAAKPGPKPAAPAPRMLAASRPAPELVSAPVPVPAPRPFYAPMMPAYAPTPVIIHAPTVQTASVMEQRPAPFVGSALGMTRSALAAPVPVATAYSAR